MPFQIIRNDITKVSADAIVNTANPKPVIGSGTDGAVYKAAGENKLLAVRQTIGDIEPGQAVHTPAFRLKAKYIIHTVGPVWVDGKHGEKDILHSCYANSLSLADKLKCKSVAFPLISSGAYGFPKDTALDVALSEIGKFLLTHDMNITLVVFDKTALELSEKLMGEIEQFIDEQTAISLREQERFHGNLRMNTRSVFLEEERRRAPSQNRRVPVFPDVTKKNLSETVGSAGQTFQEKLFELIDKSGMDDVTVYKKANIDRKVFSRIRSKRDYKPKKKTAVAFAIALELDLQTTIDLLARAEIAFSQSNLFDLIIAYFITHGIYDMFEINAALFQYDQPVLGE